MRNAQRLRLEQMREFVAAGGGLAFSSADRAEIHGLVEGVLRARQRPRLSKKSKGVVRRYLRNAACPSSRA